MRPSQSNSLIAGALVTGLGTLASRLLGYVRDAATFALLGVGGSPVMDAFVIANRIPNLFRQLFGEGALTASYLPVVAGLLETDRRSTWQLASTMMVWLSVLLAGLVLVGEAILAGIWLLWGDRSGMGLLVGLSATLLPYMLLICLAAQVTATLQALGQFTVPALTPTVLNVCWLTGVWAIAPIGRTVGRTRLTWWRCASSWPACSNWACKCRPCIGWGFASSTTGRPAAPA